MKKKTFTDDDILIVGHTDIMHAIEQSFVNSTLSPELRWKAILLAGLPGTGKSTIMSSVAIKIAKLKKTTVSVFKVRTGKFKNVETYMLRHKLHILITILFSYEKI